MHISDNAHSAHSPDTDPGALERIIARVRPSWGLAAAVLCGIVLAFYHGLWLPGLVLINRDAFVLHLPMKQYLIERLSSGELPQWFPYEALGSPFIGAAHTGVFHPFTALYLLMPVPDAYRASSLLSCLLAAIGAFLLGRMLHFSRAGALASAIAFTLSGYVVSALDNIVYLYSLCALPLFCAALEKALTEQHVWVLPPAILWATVFLNGDMQTGYYYGFIALAWTLARAPGPRLKAYLRLTLVSGLAALLAGIQLGPAWAVFTTSDRTNPALFHEQALLWSTHPLRLLTILASPVYEYQDLADIARFFFGNTHSPSGTWAESLYLGVPVIGLALLGTWHRRDLRSLAFLGLLALLLALGQFGGLYEIFYNVLPLWSAFRYPEKLMGVVTFSTAMLTGAGLDALRMKKGSATPWLAAAGVCAGIWLGLSTEAASTWTTINFGAPDALTHKVIRATAAAFLSSALASLGMGIIIAGVKKGQFRSALFLATLMAIITLDLAHTNISAYRTGPDEVASFIPTFVEVLRAREGPLEPGHFRMIEVHDDKYAISDQMLRLLGHATIPVVRRQALALTHNAQFHLEAAHAYLPGHDWTLNAMFKKKPKIEVGARFNVAYYVGNIFHFQHPQFANKVVAFLSDYDLALVQNPVPAKPRAYLSQQPEHRALPVNPVELIARADFLSGEVDVIETLDATLPGPARSGQAVIERYTPEEVRVRAETPQPAVLILLDAFDKGWTATLDKGAELPIMRANALVRAVSVPEGVHLVTFRYETPLLKAGAVTSLVGVVLCLTLIALSGWQARRRGTQV